MEYYSDEKMRTLRVAYEKRILKWPHVSNKKMFGCPCYKANGQLFSFLVTGGLVVTLLSQPEREKLLKQERLTSFRAGKKIVKNWIEFSLADEKDLKRVMLWVEKSYESALKIV